MIELAFHYGWIQAPAAFISGMAFACSFHAYLSQRQDANEAWEAWEAWFWCGLVFGVLAAAIGAA